VFAAQKFHWPYRLDGCPVGVVNSSAISSPYGSQGFCVFDFASVAEQRLELECWDFFSGKLFSATPASAGLGEKSLCGLFNRIGSAAVY
jgi:hypothetical protein